MLVLVEDFTNLYRTALEYENQNLRYDEVESDQCKRIFAPQEKRNLQGKTLLLMRVKPNILLVNLVLFLWKSALLG